MEFDTIIIVRSRREFDGREGTLTFRKILNSASLKTEIIKLELFRFIQKNFDSE